MEDYRLTRSRQVRSRLRAERPSSASAARQFAEAPEHDEAAIEEALVEREPVTGRGVGKRLDPRAAAGT
jgi:hypothetical protein